MDIENLTGRELDAAVAEAMGFTVHRREYRGMTVGWSVSSKRCRSCRKKLDEYGGPDFPTVKREIERHGWGWSCERDCDPTYQFRFDVHVPTGRSDDYCKKHSAWAESEEEAGCRAFLMACRASEREEQQHGKTQVA